MHLPSILLSALQTVVWFSFGPILTLLSDQIVEAQSKLSRHDQIILRTLRRCIFQSTAPAAVGETILCATQETVRTLNESETSPAFLFSPAFSYLVQFPRLHCDMYESIQTPVLLYKSLSVSALLLVSHSFRFPPAAGTGFS